LTTFEIVGFSGCVNVCIVVSDMTAPVPVCIASVVDTAAVVVRSGSIDLEHPEVAITNKYV